MSVSKRLQQASEKQSSITPQKLSNSAALGEVAELAERQMTLEDYIDKLEADIKDAKRQLEEVSTKLLPQAMITVGLDEIKLTSGAKISVASFYSASIKEENKAKAFDWLRKNGHSYLIKREIDVPFGKGEDAEAEKLAELLRKKKHPFTDNSSVHTQTLRAWLKEQVEGGSKIPLDLFGAFIGRKAKIKRP